MDERMRSLKYLIKLVANIILALHLDSKLSTILRLLLYATIMLFKLRFLNLRQRREVYIGAQYA